MSRSGPEGGVDDRLKHLLALEARLQERVRAAEAEAAARVTRAREAGEQVRVEAEAAEARRAEEEAAADRAAHEEALRAIRSRSVATIEALSSIPDSRIDELARTVVDCALGPPGERP